MGWIMFVFDVISPVYNTSKMSYNTCEMNNSWKLLFLTSIFYSQTGILFYLKFAVLFFAGSDSCVSSLEKIKRLDR